MLATNPVAGLKNGVLDAGMYDGWNMRVIGKGKRNWQTAYQRHLL